MAVTLRLTEDETAALRAAAEREGTSVEEVAVRAVREHLARRTDFRTTQLARFLSEDAELLDLLSQ